MQDDVRLLASLPMFRGVPTTALTHLTQACPAVRIAPGESIYAHQEVPGRSALLVIEGRIDLTLKGGSDVIGRIGPGEVAGEAVLLGHGRDPVANLTAATPVTALVLSRALLGASEANPAVVVIEQYLISSLARRLRNATLKLQRAWKDEQVDPKASPPRSGMLGWLSGLMGAR